MKTSFTSTTRIDITAAKSAAIKQYPELEVDVKPIKTAAELDEFLVSRGFVVYVDVDPNEEYKMFQDREAELGSQIEADLEDCTPVSDPIKFDADDMDLCATPPEVSIPVIDAAEIAELEKEIADIVRGNDGGLSEGLSLDEVLADPAGSKSPVGKVVKCIKEMERIADELEILVDREQRIKETLVNFEQLLYNYRVMEGYYKTKMDTLDSLTDQFTVLVREHRKIQEVSLPDVSAKIEQKKTSLSEYVLNITPGTSRPTQEETNRLNEIAKLEGNKLELQEKDTQLTESIRIAKNGTWSFNNEALQTGELLGRRAALLLDLASVGSPSALTDLSGFSSNVNLRTDDNGSFKLEIRHETTDPAGILAGRDLSFATSNGTIDILGYKSGEPNGVLYTALYNIWGDPELFFSKEERGLSVDKNNIDPALKGTDAGSVDGAFIQNLSKFNEFYSNFLAHHEAKTNTIKDTIIEPTLSGTQGSLESMAQKEIQLLLSFGKVYEILPEDQDPLGQGSLLNGIINTVRNSSSDYIDGLNACRQTYDFIVEQHDKILGSIELKKLEYSSVSCVLGAPAASVPTKESGSDPLGKDMGNEDPNDPNFTKLCYWAKFAAFATAVNVLPIPGNGGFRYWPIGLAIPTPAGVTKIPLPIIWVPLAVIPMPVGVFVVFIGQCGICPSPFVFYSGPSGEKQFIVSLRPTDAFGTDASGGLFKTVSKGGIAVNTKISALLNKLDRDGKPVQIPDFKPITNPDNTSTIISDIRESIIKKITKIGDPDITILQGISINATVNEKRAAFKQVVSDWIDKINIPNVKLPKDSSKVNPKPSPVIEIMDQLKKAISLDLPEISVSVDKIDLKDKLLSAIEKIEVSSPDLTIPQKTDTVKRAEFLDKIKVVLNKAAAQAVDKITPASLGIVAVASGGVNFLNPYACRQTPGEIKIPPMPPAIVAGLATLRGVSANTVGNMSSSKVDDLMSKYVEPGVSTVGKTILKKMLIDVVDSTLPSMQVPNPSNLSIKDMLKSNGKIAASIQLPSLPDPTKLLQPRVTIPGSVLKASIKKSVMGAVDLLDVADFPDFAKLSQVDLKQIIIGIVEDSFQPLEGTIQPFLNIINAFKSAKDKGFGEMIGLGKVNTDDTTIPVISESALKLAKKTLEVLSLSPYAAVVLAPAVFKQLHPMLVQDDLPTWDRLSLSNFLFVTFLDEWCKQGKKGGGLFENP